MSFSAGVFSINTSGQPVVSGTTISASVFNALTADLATGLSTCMLKDGTQTATAGIGFYAGTVSLPGIYLGTDTATGFYRIGLNNYGYSVNGTKLLDMSSAVFAVTGKVTASGGIGGTTTNDSAAAGIVGEYIDSSVTGYTITSSNTDITSISLTAGDWDVSLVVSNSSGGTNTWIKASISQTSATLGATFGKDWVYGSFVANEPLLACIPRLRVSLAGTTTIYAVVVSSTGNTGTGGAAYLSARRMR